MSVTTVPESTTEQASPTTRDRLLALLAVVLLVPAASVGTFLALRRPEAAGTLVFILGKVWLLGLPLAWMVLADRQRPRRPRFSTRGLGMAALTGVGIIIVIAGAYLFVGRYWIDAAGMSSKAAAMHLDQRAIYIGGAVYWCFVNALLEEYVWRWFVFSKLRTAMSGRGRDTLAAGAAVVLTALAFTIHHIIALDAYFDWRVTILASLGVFIGGVTWSWLYLRYRNIWAPYISHILADAVIFVIGYRLIFG